MAENCHERCRFAKECIRIFPMAANGFEDETYPFECGYFDKFLDLEMEVRSMEEEDDDW